MDFYSDVLHVSLTKFDPPDLQAIAENSSAQHTARLIQLMLGVAINCDQKDSESHTQYTIITHPMHIPSTP